MEHTFRFRIRRANFLFAKKIANGRLPQIKHQWNKIGLTELYCFRRDLNPVPLAWNDKRDFLSGLIQAHLSIGAVNKWNLPITYNAQHFTTEYAAKHILR
jgi:hypothetical protein